MHLVMGIHERKQIVCVSGVYKAYIVQQVCVLHLAFPMSTVPGFLLNVGDPVRSNTLSVEISLCNGLDDVSLCVCCVSLCVCVLLCVCASVCERNVYVCACECVLV